MAASALSVSAALTEVTVRTTLSHTVRRSGVGLHGGRPCAVTLRPADRPGWTLCGALVGPAVIADATLATTLTTPAGPVSTVEHLFAALAGCGVDDVAIDVEGGEVPALDGSAAPWVAAIDAAAPVGAAAPAPAPLIVERPLRVGDDRRWIAVTPAERLELAVAIDFPLIGRQAFEAPAADFRAVADARTFGFARDAAALRAAGRALGAGLHNAAVFDDAGRPLDPLRHPDEPARHKWLDLLGDLALLGRPLRARVEAYAAGHALHHRLVRALAAGATDGRAGDS